MIRQMFNKPRRFNTFLTRQVDPTELFWDLIFVVTLRYIIDSFVSNYTPYTFAIGLIVFIHVYLFWLSFNIYNVNFHDVSHNNRLLMTISLTPLLIVAAISDYTQESALIYLGVSFLILKLMQAFTWNRAIRIHETDYSYRSLNYLYKTEVKTYILCAVIALLIIIFPKSTFILLVLMLLIELLLPTMRNYRRKSSYAFDRILIAERFLLFIILIFGEGIIGVVHILSYEVDISGLDIIRGFIVFFTLYTMFLKVYDEYTINKESISTTFMIYLTTYVISSMLLISSLILIGYNHQSVDSSIRVISLVSLCLYYLTYINNSFRYLTIRRQSLNNESINYYQFDLLSSIIALVLSIFAIIFIGNIFILLIVICLLVIFNTIHIKMRSKIVANIYQQDHTIVNIK